VKVRGEGVAVDLVGIPLAEEPMRHPIPLLARLAAIVALLAGTAGARRVLLDTRVGVLEATATDLAGPTREVILDL